MTSAENFSKLKKELLFHEKRMALLLGTTVVEDLPSALREKSEARHSCLRECKRALESLESNAASVSKLSGRWGELRIASTFGLGVPLNLVVGSEKFERPTIKVSDIKELVVNAQSLSDRYSEFAPIDADQGGRTVEDLLNDIQNIEWTPRDMSRMKNAVAAKLAVLTELNELTKALQDAQYSISCEELHLEKLRRREEQAVEEGEMAVSDSTIREKMETIEKIIDLLFFQAHTIDSSIDSNVSKKRSNVALFQQGIETLSCIKQEKAELLQQCSHDAVKLQRGLEYEAKVHGDSKSTEELRESVEKLQKIDQRQMQLCARLAELFTEVNETEQALQELSARRYQAVTDHLDLVESRRHITSDNIERAKFAELYRRNLEKTSLEYQRSIAAVEKMERLLLRQQTYDQFDFQSTAKRLGTMQKRVCIELNRALHEYETSAEELVRRLSAQQKALQESIEENEAEAELRKETFDPMAKKFVLRVQELSAERDRIAVDVQRLREQVSAERAACFARLEKVIGKDEIVDAGEINEHETLARRETLLDWRQELIEPPEVGILDARQQLARDYQSAAIAAERSKQSRVLSIREDVTRHKHSAEDSDRITAQEIPSEMPDVSAVINPDSSSAQDSHLEERGVLSVAVSKNNEERTMQYRGRARTIQS
jgi:hypothetical protein